MPVAKATPLPIANADPKDKVRPEEVNKVAVVPPKMDTPTPAPKIVQIPTPNPVTYPPSVLPI